MCDLDQFSKIQSQLHTFELVPLMKLIDITLAIFLAATFDF